LEFRANRLISGYIYLIVLMMVFSLLVPISFELFEPSSVKVFVSLFAVFLAILVTIVGYDRFCRLVERRLLNMPLASSELLQSYTDRIATSLDTTSLVALIKEKVLPSLLIRQSALLNLSKEQQVSVVYYHGIAVDQLPPEIQIARLSSNRQVIHNDINGEDGHAWVRLALPLRVGDELVGLWLMGRRDPDNVYTNNEIATLRTLANQTAIALANINQAEMLQMLYRANISSQEIERERLARDLHDVVLNQLAIMIMKLDEETAEALKEDYEMLVRYLRQTIQGLRPPALNYGLRTALEAFCDDLSDRANGDIMIHFEIDPCDVHLDPTVESHLYRIMQQAGENVMRHANARNMHVYGDLSPTLVDLHLCDDGVGFNTRAGVDLSTLLAHEHFGLVGMHERARIINAELKIESRPEKGTNISVIWKPDKSLPDEYD
jgi:signal transduction histidine kinase